jgi:outer membrane murein-binding lipoprotein Lpp
MLQKSGRVRFMTLLCLCVWLVISGCSSNSKKDQTSSSALGMADKGTMTEMSQANTESRNVQFGKDVAAAPAAAEAPAAAAVKGLDAGSGIEATKGFTAVNTTESWDRKVIYKGNLTMEVPDYSAAQTEINNLVTLASGYILQFSENQSTAEKSGNYVIKVPANGFSSFIRDLEKIKTVSDIRHNIQGQDVSEEYVDLSSRLKAKQVVEARLLAFMEKAEKTADLLSFSNELGNVQESIEQIKGRMRYLDQNVAMSTVEIRLYEQGVAKKIAPVVGDSTLEKTKNALSSSMHALKVIAQGLLVFIAAMVPVLIVLAIIGIPLIIILRKRARKQALNASPPANYTQKIDTSGDSPQDPS